MTHNHSSCLGRMSLVLLFLFPVCHSKADGEKEGRGAEFRATGGDKELFKRASSPNNEPQANRIRVELWFYWERKMNRVYQRLQRHYELRPELAGLLRASQQAWLTTRDATIHAYSSCLNQREENNREDGWFNAHMNLMIIEMTETRCRVLEELLNTVQSCNL